MYIDGSIHIEKSDQCYTCEHFRRGVSCPLLEALALGVVELTSEISVENCGFYKRFDRHLRVISNDNLETLMSLDDETETTK